jgi:adenylate cyclase
MWFNTASRLEELTKTYRVPILTSETTLNIDPEVPRTFAHRYLGRVPIKGKLESLKVYEVLDSSDEYFEAKYDNRELFSQAVQAQEEGDSKQKSEALPGISVQKSKRQSFIPLCKGLSSDPKLVKQP